MTPYLRKHWSVQLYKFPCNFEQNDDVMKRFSFYWLSTSKRDRSAKLWCVLCLFFFVFFYPEPTGEHTIALTVLNQNITVFWHKKIYLKLRWQNDYNVEALTWNFHFLKPMPKKYNSLNISCIAFKIGYSSILPSQTFVINLKLCLFVQSFACSVEQ